MPNLYWRKRKGGTFAYIDLRDLGLKQEPLRAPGERTATQDEATAHELFAKRVRAAGRLGVPTARCPLLSVYGGAVLVRKARSQRATPQTIRYQEHHLREIVRLLGDRPLDAIRPRDVRELEQLLYDKGAAHGTVRSYLNDLSSVFRYALEDEHVRSNPVAALSDKPRGVSGATLFLNAPEVDALLRASLEESAAAARLVFVLFYTGARMAEVLGLRCEDVSLAEGVIRIAPHASRRLKGGEKHSREVPLWDELRTVLQPHLAPQDRTPPTGFLFPGSRGWLRDARKTLDAVARRAKLPTSRLRGRVTRVTYVAHRLQTTDGGKPVSFYTVARECGHSTAVCEQVYARLPANRYRGDQVAYRAAVAATGSAVSIAPSGTL